MMPKILTRVGHMPAAHAADGQAIQPGRIYVAPADRHLLIKRGFIQLTRGPKENGVRPAIDPLFRTAARAYGHHVVGVVLSGGLDDGTAGMVAIKLRGGINIVQDPKEAMFPSMPLSAIENDHVDHILPLDEIAPMLVRLANEPLPEEEGDAAMPSELEQEEDRAEGGTVDLLTHELKGPPSVFTCPECGGTLWELHAGDLTRFQCHVGHAYSVDSLLTEQLATLEMALWSGLRALEERAELTRRLAGRAREREHLVLARRFDRDAHESEERAAVIRQALSYREHEPAAPTSLNEE